MKKVILLLLLAAGNTLTSITFPPETEPAPAVYTGIVALYGLVILLALLDSRGI